MISINSHYFLFYFFNLTIKTVSRKIKTEKNRILKKIKWILGKIKQIS